MLMFTYQFCLQQLIFGNTFMFGISIYASPEHFLALSLGLFHNNKEGVQELAQLLGRTKSPPISAVYTYELLQHKTWSEYGLDVIRFLSQLSDLTEGASVSSSLYKVIGESSLLTQIRHNLTHKIKISDYLIELSRRIILNELKQKYWNEQFQRYTESYHIQMEKVREQYERIYKAPLTEELVLHIKNNLRKVTADWLKNESTNYQFKEFFPAYHQEHSQKQVLDFLGELTSHKKAISISYLIRKFYYDNKNEDLTQLLIKLIKKQNPAIFSENLVFSSLKKLTYLHYLGNCSKVIAVLPKETIEELGKYWEGRQKVLLKNKAGLKIYKIFQKQSYLLN